MFARIRDQNNEKERQNGEILSNLRTLMWTCSPEELKEKLTEYISNGFDINASFYEGNLIRHIIFHNYFDFVDIVLSFDNLDVAKIPRYNTNYGDDSYQKEQVFNDIFDFLEDHVNDTIEEIENTQSPSDKYTQLLQKYEQVKIMILKIVKYIHPNLSYEFPVV
jgi:hypothetical protein